MTSLPKNHDEKSSQAGLDRRPGTSRVTGGFSYIGAGTFRMGSDHEGSAERPVHDVHVSEFWCALHVTTNAEFGRFVEGVAYRTTAELSVGHRQPGHGGGGTYWTSWRDFATPDRDNHPVVAVSWFDAEAYCKWLTRTTGVQHRLPTEAEWEKAARGGLDGAPYPWGWEAAEDVCANFGHMGPMSDPRTVPVNQLPRNGYGLSMGGNVWEWVNDWYEADYYGRSSSRDPQGPTVGQFKVRRGGAFNNRNAFRLQVASRNRLLPNQAFLNMGFRVVRDGVTAGTDGGDCFPQYTVGQRPPTEAEWDDVIRRNLHQETTLAGRIENVLNVLRPNMEIDDGGVIVRSVEDGTVRLEMMGTCRNCPKSDRTFQDVAQVLKRNLREIEKVERVGH